MLLKSGIDLKMDLFLDSLSKEVCSLTQSATKAEQSHSQLQDEYLDLQLQTRNQLIQSSLGVHIPSSKSSRDIAQSARSKSENLVTHKSNLVSGVNSFPKNHVMRKSKPKSKSQKKIYDNRNENMTVFNRPCKMHKLSSTINPVRPPLNNSNEINKNSEISQFSKTLNLNNVNQPKQQDSSRSNNNLRFTQRSLNLNSSRRIVPAHPFIISPSLGGEGFDYQDYKHFTEIPPIQNERRTVLKKAKSPFFARAFSETANPNCPHDSPMRRSKEDKIDFNIQVF